MSAAESLARPLRIVHVNTHDEEGGAAKIMHQLCLFQRRAGHVADMLVGRRNTKNRRVRVLDACPDDAVEPFFIEANLQYLHLQGSHALDQHPLVAAADVVHLHNLHSGYVNPISLAVLTRSKPTVWTLHDMHAFTGFCNHAFDCQGWTSGCRDCGRQALDRVRPTFSGTGKAALAALGIATGFDVKQAVYAASVLNVACPSRWLADKASRGLLGCQPVCVVPNGVDTRVFAPRDKARARARLGLPQNAFILGAAAVNGIFANPLKGGELALAALKRLRRRVPGALLLNIGALGQSGLPGVLNLPYLRTEREMAWAYAAMDALLHCAGAETFCLVAAEAQACGRPVLSFDVGPLPELVQPGQNGLLAPSGDAEALAGHALRLAEDPALARRMGDAARAGAQERFSLAAMAADYMGLYRRAVAGHAERLAATPPLDLERLPLFLHTAPLLRGLKRAGLPLPASAGQETGEELLERYLATGPDTAQRRLFATARERVQAHKHVFVLRSQKRWGEALRLLEELLADAPFDARLSRTYGVTLGLSGRPDLGLAAFAHCAEADPVLSDLPLGICDMYRLMGDVDRALEALKAMDGRDPDGRGLALRRGILLEQRGDARGAAAMYQREFDLHGDANAGRKAKELGAGAACPAGQPERPATARSARTKAPAKRGRAKKGN